MTRRKDAPYREARRRSITGSEWRDPEVRLVTAVLVDAGKAARRGDKMAVRFLETELAQDWLGLCGISASAWRRFRDGL